MPLGIISQNSPASSAIKLGSRRSCVSWQGQTQRPPWWEDAEQYTLGFVHFAGDSALLVLRPPIARTQETALFPKDRHSDNVCGIWDSDIRNRRRIAPAKSPVTLEAGTIEIDTSVTVH